MEKNDGTLAALKQTSDGTEGLIFHLGQLFFYQTRWKKGRWEKV